MSTIRNIASRLKQKILGAEPAPQAVMLDLNTRYDLETAEIIRRLPKDANCIDVGAHKGDILQSILWSAPLGRHFAFEPLPHLYGELKEKFGKKCAVFPYALSDLDGQTSFNYVITNPAYSGIKKRKYDRPDEQDSVITVEKKRLDNVVPADLPIHFIKIDVEGGEFDVVKGAEKILKKYHPIIVYEQGKGGSDVYGTEPQAFFDYMTSLGYSISLMEYYLLGKEPLTLEEYGHQFSKSYNFYFIAYMA